MQSSKLALELSAYYTISYCAPLTPSAGLTATGSIFEREAAAQHRVVGEARVVYDLHFAYFKAAREDVVDCKVRLLGRPCRDRPPVCADAARLEERLVVLGGVDLGLSVGEHYRRVEVPAYDDKWLVLEIDAQGFRTARDDAGHVPGGADAAADRLDLIGARHEDTVGEESNQHLFQSGRFASGYATSSLMALVA